MGISRFSATVIVPLMARLLLGTLFLTSGWSRCAETTTITAAQAEVLRVHGVEATPIGDESALADDGTDGAAGEYEVRRLYTLIQVMEPYGFGGWSKWLAWTAALTELLGGVMMLLGIFTRIGALGLAIVMAVGFHAVSIRLNGMLSISPFLWHQHPQMLTMTAQACLFMLATGLVLTGPGPVSIDRLIRSGVRADLDEFEEDD